MSNEVKVKQVPVADLKFQPIYKEYDNGVVIYNVSKEKEEQLRDVYASAQNEDSLDLSGMTLITKLLPILSNVDLTGLSEEELNAIIEEPSDEFVDLITEVHELAFNRIYTLQRLNQLGSKMEESADNMRKMNKEPVLTIVDDKVEKIEDVEVVDMPQKEKVELTPEELEKFKAFQESEEGI